MECVRAIRISNPCETSRSQILISIVFSDVLQIQLRNPQWILFRLDGPNPSFLVQRKFLAVEILCFIGIVLLLHSASRTLFVLGVNAGPSASAYYIGLQGALAPFENLEGFVGTLLAINPLFILAITRA
jgi:hypothetical protein